jgi:hypothetical protein
MASKAKQKMTEVIQAQLDDATYDEILRSWRSSAWSSAASPIPGRAGQSPMTN